MAIMRDRGVVTTMRRGRSGAARPVHLPITLADLITAIQDVVGPKDDGLVVATVRHLLRSGGLAGHGAGTRRCSGLSIIGKEVKAIGKDVHRIPAAIQELKR
jgi:hypothetical protein